VEHQHQEEAWEEEQEQRREAACCLRLLGGRGEGTQQMKASLRRIIKFDGRI
jgi:hypothetical protein